MDLEASQSEFCKAKEASIQSLQSRQPFLGPLPKACESHVLLSLPLGDQDHKRGWSLYPSCCMRHLRNDHLRNGRMAEYNGPELRSRDVDTIATSNASLFFQSVCDKDVAVIIYVTVVAAMEPSVVIESFSIRSIVGFVASKSAGAVAEIDLA